MRWSQTMERRQREAIESVTEDIDLLQRNAGLQWEERMWRALFSWTPLSENFYVLLSHFVGLWCLLYWSLLWFYVTINLLFSTTTWKLAPSPPLVFIITPRCSPYHFPPGEYKLCKDKSLTVLTNSTSHCIGIGDILFKLIEKSSQWIHVMLWDN